MLVQDFYSAYDARDYDELPNGTVLAVGRKAVQEYIRRNRDVAEFRPLRERDEERKPRESKPRPESAKAKARKPEQPHAIVGLWADGLLVRTFDPWKVKPEKILEAWKAECAKRPYENLELAELHHLRGRTGKVLGSRKAAPTLGRAYERPHARWCTSRNRDVASWDASTKVHTRAPRRF